MFAILESDRHAIVRSICVSINTYRLQSPSHHALHIAVQLDKQQNEGANTRILFCNFSQHIVRASRPVFLKGKLERVKIREKGRWITVQRFLTKNFPSETSLVTDDTIRRWWDQNGQSFNWPGLPTELKEHVLQFCIYQHYDESLEGGNRPLVPQIFRNRRIARAQEIIDQLSDWAALLRVSREMRALTLRLCFSGSIHNSAGLTIIARQHRDLSRAIWRLDRLYQVVGPNSIPLANCRSRNQAYQYSRFPKLYPQLSQYATFKHGIRTLDLDLGWMNTLHFFKVTVGGLHRYRRQRFMTCDVLDQLPNLQGVKVTMPKTSSMNWGPIEHNRAIIFHEEHACPRTLHQWIYERAAEVLASYKDIQIGPFMDSQEEAKFYNLRQAIALSHTMDDDDLRSLYNGSDGGIEVNDDSSTSPCLGEEPRKTALEDKATVEENPGEALVVLPPRCNCEVPCPDMFLD